MWAYYISRPSEPLFRSATFHSYLPSAARARRICVARADASPLLMARRRARLEMPESSDWRVDLFPTPVLIFLPLRRWQAQLLAAAICASDLRRQSPRPLLP